MDYQTLYRDGLLDDIVAFWLKHGLDAEYGGIFSSLDRKGNIYDSDKSVWAQARSAWLLAEIYNEPRLENHPDRDNWLMAAVSIADFLTAHCFDPVDNRLWFHVTREGKPIRKRRYAFSESFAAIAYGELALATGTAEYADRARVAFDRFISHSHSDSVAPKFTSTRPAKAIGFPMIGIVTAQELRGSIGLESADQLIAEWIAEIREDFWWPDIGCVMENVSPEGTLLDSTDGKTLNPGHAIEAAWFILREGQHCSDWSMIELGLAMLDAMFERGWDREHGGLLYFVGLDDFPVQEYWHEMKFWWPHNELIIAAALASQITGEEKYRALHEQAHQWAFEHFPDSESGEWFGYLRTDGTVSNPCKGNHWKSLFHVPRMFLECWRAFDG